MKTIAALLAVLVGAFGTPVWAEVRVHDPVVRMVPPGQPISVAFMTLHNHGMDEKILVKVYLLPSLLAKKPLLTHIILVI